MPCIMLNVFYKQRSNKHERNSDLNLFHFFRPNLYRICFKVDNQEIDWFFSDMNFWSALPILTFGRHFQETEKKTVFGIDFYLMLRHLQRDNSIHSFQRHTSKPILSRPLDIEIYLNNYSNNSSKKKFCVCDHQSGEKRILLFKLLLYVNIIASECRKFTVLIIFWLEFILLHIWIDFCLQRSFFFVI